MKIYRKQRLYFIISDFFRRAKYAMLFDAILFAAGLIFGFLATDTDSGIELYADCKRLALWSACVICVCYFMLFCAYLHRRTYFFVHLSFFVLGLIFGCAFDKMFHRSLFGALFAVAIFYIPVFVFTFLIIHIAVCLLDEYKNYCILACKKQFHAFFCRFMTVFLLNLFLVLFYALLVCKPFSVLTPFEI